MVPERQICFNPEELRTKEFNRFVDAILTNGSPSPDTFHNLTLTQKEVFSVLNRALKRLSK